MIAAKILIQKLCAFADRYRSLPRREEKQSNNGSYAQRRSGHCKRRAVAEPVGDCAGGE